MNTVNVQKKKNCKEECIMDNRLLGEYVVVEDGKVHLITQPTPEQMDKAYEGISTQEIEQLKSLSREELLTINNGETVVLKHIGVYLTEQNMFAESTIASEEQVKEHGVSGQEIKYNYLADLIVPTDSRYTMVWG